MQNSVAEQDSPRMPEQVEVPATQTPVNSQPVSETTITEERVESIAASPVVSQAPVFKVQFMASTGKIRNGDGHREGGMYKYTVGSSSDYNQIYRLRKEILDKFPGAFIIAFKDGAKMNVNEAIREFKANKGKK